jgi:hypothetical protein
MRFGSKAAWRSANSQELAGLLAAVHKVTHSETRNLNLKQRKMALGEGATFFYNWG